MPDLGRAPDRVNVNIQRGFPFRASIKMRDGSDWESAPEIRLDSGDVWPSAVSGDVASWDIPAATVDAARHGEHVQLVYGADVLWGEGRLQEGVGVGFGGQSQVLVLPHPGGGQAITSPAIKGDEGRGIASIVDPDASGTAVVTYTDGTVDELPLPPGPQGQDGAPGGSDEATAVWVEEGPETRAVLDAQYATGNEYRSRAKTDGSDQTSVVRAELDALVDAGGGTLILPASPINAPILVANITIKNDGAPLAKQPPIVIRGQGMHWSGRGSAPQGGTTLQFTAANTHGLIQTRGLGSLRLENLTLRNVNTAISTPFLYTTNTTLLVRNVAFVGAKTGLACDQDAVVCGGTENIEGQSGWTHGFQGYGTVVESCFFSGIRRAVYGRTFFNANRVIGNTIWTTCGHADGACIELDGDAAGTAAGTFSVGNVISDNLIELPNYKIGVRLRYASRNTLRHNNFYDAQEVNNTVAVLVESQGLANMVLEGFTDQRAVVIEDRSGTTVFHPSTPGLATPILNVQAHQQHILVMGRGGQGASGVSSDGSRATIQAASLAQGHPRSRIVSAVGASVANASIEAGSRTLTSSTAGFAIADQGLLISGAGIPSNTYIASVESATTVTMTKPATVTATGVTVSWPRTTTPLLEEVEFSRSHWRALGANPTAAVGPGTGTGGSAAVAGKDVAGRLTITTGSSPSAGAIGSWNPAINYNTIPRVQLTARNQATAALLAGGCWVSGSTSSQTVNVIETPTAGTIYEFDYVVLEA